MSAAHMLWRLWEYIIDMPQAAIAQPVSGPSVIPVQGVMKQRASRSSLPTIETSRLVLRARATGDADTLAMTILLKPGLFEAGRIQFDLRDAVDREVEFRFFLDPPFRGRGLMREAVRAAAPQALRLLGARLLYATLPADALAAQQVARALGLSPSPGRGPMRRFEKDLGGLI